MEHVEVEYVEKDFGNMDSNHSELVVMLTHYDRTVEDAYRVFEACRNTRAKYWGFKEDPLPLPQMKELYAFMKACGKTTSLEVVAYTEAECLAGARMAAECGVDYLMGTMYFDSVNQICRGSGIRYMPFVGDVTDRPSILRGSAEGMVEEAMRYADKGVYGIDLLGYRYEGDATALNRTVIGRLNELGIPVCLAGSVNSMERLQEIREMRPMSFTIGGAFFEQKFGEGFAEQVDKVCAYMENG